MGPPKTCVLASLSIQLRRKSDCQVDVWNGTSRIALAFTWLRNCRKCLPESPRQMENYQKSFETRWFLKQIDRQLHLSKVIRDGSQAPSISVTLPFSIVSHHHIHLWVMFHIQNRQFWEYFGRAWDSRVWCLDEQHHLSGSALDQPKVV